MALLSSYAVFQQAGHGGQVQVAHQNACKAPGSAINGDSNRQAKIFGRTGQVNGRDKRLAAVVHMGKVRLPAAVGPGTARTNPSVHGGIDPVGIGLHAIGIQLEQHLKEGVGFEYMVQRPGIAPAWRLQQALQDVQHMLLPARHAGVATYGLHHARRARRHWLSRDRVWPG